MSSDDFSSSPQLAANTPTTYAPAKNYNKGIAFAESLSNFLIGQEPVYVQLSSIEAFLVAINSRSSLSFGIANGGAW